MISEPEVRKIAAKLEIPMVGIIEATPLTDFEQRCSKRAFTPFCHIEPKIRVDFKKAFARAESVIVIGLPYRLRKVKSSHEENAVHIASFCEERDYHLRVREKLEALAQGLRQMQEFDYRIFVDRAQLIDRASAWKAGLGFFGKNNCLIHPKYGSAFVIGQLPVSVPIAHHPAMPMDSRCGNCEKCLKACPNHALGEGFDLDANRCISYLTQKKRLNENEKDFFRTYLYGCDICQLVCPFNTLSEQDEDDFENGLNLSPSFQSIFEMDDTDFKTHYGDSPLYWRGLEVIKRNGEILFHEK